MFESNFKGEFTMYKKILMFAIMILSLAVSVEAILRLKRVINYEKNIFADNDNVEFIGIGRGK